MEKIALDIVGRHKEQAVLKKVFNSPKSEFMAIYGRRRVGKTYLIRQFFSKQSCLYFQITGEKDCSLRKQLTNFIRSLEGSFYRPGTRLQIPNSWSEALSMLTDSISEHIKETKGRVILFFDELPWLATKRSKFIQALDQAWNNIWVDIPNIRLIACGSAASWMIDNLISSKGGLHNRLTNIMRLEPFTLAEAKDFLNYKNITLDIHQLVQLYMVTGGVPLYLDHVNKGLSTVQNVENLSFQVDGLLYKEFKQLFASLFNNCTVYEELVRTIASKNYGIGQSDLIAKTKLSTPGGTVNKRLNALEEAGFITSFLPYGNKQRGLYYKVIDEYTLFYLRWVEPVKHSIKRSVHSPGYWLAKTRTPAWQSWAGLAFEAICYKHINNIRQALKIDPGAEVGTWRHVTKSGSEENGAQIDLLFDRDDGIITLCEIKYSSKPFVIDKQYYQNILNKIAVYQKVTKTTKQIFVAFITSNGLKTNRYSEELVTQDISLHHLFG